MQLEELGHPPEMFHVKQCAKLFECGNVFEGVRPSITRRKTSLSAPGVLSPAFQAGLVPGRICETRLGSV
jgi:hypothetical protein